MEEVKETVEVTEEVTEVIEGIGADEVAALEAEVQTTFNEDTIDILVEDGEVENETV